MEFCNYLNLPRLDSLILFGKHGAGLDVNEILNVCDILESYILRCMLCSIDRTETYKEIYNKINTFF